MPSKKFRSACVQFKSRKNCKDPCKYIIKKVKDLRTGMMKNIGYCKTKYAHLKKKLRKTSKLSPKQQKKMVEMGKDIQDLEKISADANKANEKVVEKAAVIAAVKIPTVNDISKTVSNVSETVSSFFVSKPAAPSAPTGNEEPKKPVNMGGKKKRPRK